MKAPLEQTDASTLREGLVESLLTKSNCPEVDASEMTLA